MASWSVQCNLLDHHFYFAFVFRIFSQIFSGLQSIWTNEDNTNFIDTECSTEYLNCSYVIGEELQV